MKRAWKTLERVKYRAKDGEKKRERGTRGRRKGMNAWGSVGGGEGVEKVGNGISRARVEDKMAGTLSRNGRGWKLCSWRDCVG